MNFKALTLALAATLAMGAAQAQSLSVSPSPKDVLIGENFVLEVTADSFANPIIGGGFELSFDPTILQLASVDIPAAWEFARSGGTIDNAAGTVKDAFFATFSAPKAGSFLTGTLTFKAVGLGSSAVTVSANAAQPFVVDGTLDVVSPVFKAGLVNVAAVPEPSAMVLVLAGAGLMGAIGRRRKEADKG